MTSMSCPRRQLAVNGSLYTTIPHKEGIEACRSALLSTEETNLDQPPVDFNGNSVTKQHLPIQQNSFQTALPWELLCLQHMQTYSWDNSRRGSWQKHPRKILYTFITSFYLRPAHKHNQITFYIT